MSPRIGVFCKTFKPDLPWLFHALQSFEINWRYDWSETKLLVVAEPDCESELRRWAFTHVKVIYVEPFSCGYCHAMATKLSADIYLPKCDLILLFDSDMMLTRPTELKDLLSPNPTIVYDFWATDYDQATREVAHKVWSPAVKRSMGVDLDRDWMVSPLWLYWSSTFQGSRQMIESHCRMPFWQAVYCNHPYDWQKFTEHPFKLCDMQALGVYAWERESHLYRFMQRSSTLSAIPIVQGWSHAVDKQPVIP